MTVRYGKVAKDFKAEAAAFRRSLTKDLGGYIAPREVEFIAFNADGRVGDPNYGRLSELTGKVIEREVLDLLKQYPAATGVAVEVGFDAWENFWYFAHKDDGYDYEPRVDHYSVDVSRDEALAA